MNSIPMAPRPQSSISIGDVIEGGDEVSFTVESLAREHGSISGVLSEKGAKRRIRFAPDGNGGFAEDTFGATSVPGPLYQLVPNEGGGFKLTRQTGS